MLSIQNCRIHIFDDSKHLNTNENAIVNGMENIWNIILYAPEIQDCLTNASCIELELAAYFVTRNCYYLNLKMIWELVPTAT